jgi:predicted nucleotidyltransferase
MRLLLENLPASLSGQRESIAACLRAMDAVLPLKAAYLFGSHARGEGRPDSDVDLCLVSEKAESQLGASRRWSETLLGVWPRPAFTLIPITPCRLDEKQRSGDHFFATVLKEGVPLAAQD